MRPPLPNPPLAMVPQVLTPQQFVAAWPARPADSHKGVFGSVLHVAGSVHYRGAAALSTQASMRVGVGYALLLSVPEVANSVTAQTPDVIAVGARSLWGCLTRGAIREFEAMLPRSTAVAMGCGLASLGGYPRGLKAFFADALARLAHAPQALVLDADGLNLLSHMHPQPVLPVATVMTPHPKECARLMGWSLEQVQADRDAAAFAVAKQFRAVVLLKGAHTVITDGKQLWHNPTGNSALAKAGTGDVLTGLIAGLLAQGVSALQAAVLGAWLHGRVADVWAESRAAHSLLASDLLALLPQVLYGALDKAEL